ncbi:apolipoprotein N-acyltransferase [Pelistega sp. NLN82]|uniref:Apolipoprotein N-acyltransferase n=1 Tax=Pelistega ratti TaxID=2652177 RepID=A0A6L9Y7P7_9BURK|nr:apolipoprotein N-acyltransferase [Pelistega ratti]NEN76421.1 apolipoprotein N-acyltransferase [Pelistega ratti]
MMYWIILLTMGVLHAQSFSANTNIASPLQLITLAVLFFYILRSQQKWQAVKYSFIFSIASFCSGIYWLYISMNTYGNLPPPLAAGGVFLLSCYLCLYPAFASFIFKYINPKVSIYATLLLATTWATGEWLRATLLTGFPWLNIAYAHVDSPLSAWTTLWGTYGLAFLIAWIASLLALCFIYIKQSSIQKVGIPALIIFSIISIGKGLQYIDWSVPIQDPLSVRLVQGNIDQYEKFHPTTKYSSMMKNFTLAAQETTSKDSPPQIVIFPETIIPSFQFQLPIEFWESIIQQARTQQSHYLIGTPYLIDTAEKSLITNSVILLNGQTQANDIYAGHHIQHYDKQHLVPFGEYIPYGFQWFVNALGIPLGNFDIGTHRQDNFIIHNQVFAANICYEDIFGDELLDSLFPYQKENKQIDPGATILFNISNLAWFGDSAALHQHLQMARMRAIETARPILRATNTGATAHINEKGVVLASLPYLSAGILDVEVQGMSGFTPYAYGKNYPFLLLMGIILIFAFYKRKNK